jgi:tetratricopeptide (TPR) repeat protein
MSLGVAVVFAIHPLHVESVAWMSDRPTLVCATFGIGSVWAYAAGVRRWAVGGLYVAALLCKPTAVSLPFAMLAIDYFPLRRHEQLGWRRLVREKIVWIGLAAAVSVATMITESRARTLVPLQEDPLSQRLWVMFQGLAFYPWKLVWPGRLVPCYPLRSGLSLSQWPVLMSLVGVVTITALAVLGRRRLPALAAGWFAYVMLVLPVSGLTQTGSQLVALRYAYVVILPPLLLAGGAVLWMWRRSTTMIRLAVIGLVAAELSAFAAATRRLIPNWHNDETLWRATLASSPDSEFANRALAITLLEHGRASEALEYAQRDVQLAPQLCWTHMTLGNVFNRLGRLSDAIEQCEQALRIRPDVAEAHYYLGNVLMESGRVPEAIVHYEQALRLKPDYAEVHNNLGVALKDQGQVPEAIAHYEQALRLDPGYAEAHGNLGIALVRLGRTQEAVVHWEQALRLKPDDATGHYNLGLALASLGRMPEAIAHYEQALRLKPDYAGAHYNLGNALMRSGRMPEAIEHWEQALRIKPDYAEAHNNLGTALMRSGRMPEAMEHWEQALRLNPDYAEAHCNLGVALGLAGRIPEAMEHWEQALRIKPDYAEAQNRLAWSLATRAPADGGDPVRAIALAQEACERAGNRVATYLDTLAAAYAAAGRYNDASVTAEKAIDLARGGQPELARSIEARLELYRSGQAYRQSVGETGPHTP